VADGTTPHANPTPDPLPPADRLLLRRCLDAEPGAWDAFFERYAGLLAHVVGRAAAQRGVPLGPADRDELIADVLVEILRNDAAVLRAFHGRSSFSTYLTVIARRVAVRSMMRAAEARRTVGGGHRQAAQAVARHDGESAQTDRDQIETLLHRLDPAEAQIVRLFHLEERSYGDISRLTGMPLGSIGPTLSRARQKMRGEDGLKPEKA